MGTQEMSNSLKKTECVAARVFGSREARGRFLSRLTSPVQQRIFFVLSTLEAQERLPQDGRYSLV